nr:hypothetical protein [Tanacetum cinerariifolium]
ERQFELAVSTLSFRVYRATNASRKLEMGMTYPDA